MKKILMIVGGITLGIIALVVVIFMVMSINSKKLVCKSNKGNITLMYNDKTIKGYVANGITYNLDEQKLIAEQIGVENYIEEFSSWFSNNTDGTCK